MKNYFHTLKNIDTYHNLKYRYSKKELDISI